MKDIWVLTVKIVYIFNPKTGHKVSYEAYMFNSHTRGHGKIAFNDFIGAALHRKVCILHPFTRVTNYGHGHLTVIL